MFGKTVKVFKVFWQMFRKKEHVSWIAKHFVFTCLNNVFRRKNSSETLNNFCFSIPLTYFSNFSLFHCLFLIPCLLFSFLLCHGPPHLSLCAGFPSPVLFSLIDNLLSFLTAYIPCPSCQILDPFLSPILPVWDPPFCCQHDLHTAWFK